MVMQVYGFALAPVFGEEPEEPDFKGGGRAGARTQDPLIKSQVFNFSKLIKKHCK